MCFQSVGDEFGAGQLAARDDSAVLECAQLPMLGDGPLSLKIDLIVKVDERKCAVCRIRFANSAGRQNRHSFAKVPLGRVPITSPCFAAARQSLRCKHATTSRESTKRRWRSYANSQGGAVRCRLRRARPDCFLRSRCVALCWPATWRAASSERPRRQLRRILCWVTRGKIAKSLPAFRAFVAPAAVHALDRRQARERQLQRQVPAHFHHAILR